MSDRTGQQFGNYQLVRLLGRGGFAEVYLGQHRFLRQRQVAIKILSTRLNVQDSADFQREANQLAALKHPHIVPLLDFAVQDELAYLVMEYYAAGTLRQRYPRRTRLPLPQVLSYVQQIALALDYAHSQRVVHRDVKPENMLIGQAGEILITDFGGATIAHATSSMSEQTPLGTLPYMAPEQIQAQARPASDQYALGIVAYEWLAGERPFDGAYSEILAKHLMAPPPPLRSYAPELPLAVEQVLQIVLAKNPKERFPNVQTFASALIQAANLTPIQPTDEPTLVRNSDGLLTSAATMPAGPTVEVATQPEASAFPTPAPPHTGMQTPVFPLANPQTPGMYPQGADIQTPAFPLAYPRSQQEVAPHVQSQPNRALQAQRASRGARLWLVVLIVLLVFALSAGGTVLTFNYLAVHSTPTPGQNQVPVTPGPTITVTTAPSVSPTVPVRYPDVTGQYSGSILNTYANISSTMTLQLSQDQANVSGQFSVALPLQGNGPLAGNIDTHGNLQFTVVSPDTAAPILFQGSVQGDGSLSGTYCSINLQDQCDTSVGGHGTWHVTKN